VAFFAVLAWIVKERGLRLCYLFDNATTHCISS
jgi:hypothetical protein